MSEREGYRLDLLIAQTLVSLDNRWLMSHSWRHSKSSAKSWKNSYEIGMETRSMHSQSKEEKILRRKE